MDIQVGLQETPSGRGEEMGDPAGATCGATGGVLKVVNKRWACLLMEGEEKLKKRERPGRKGGAQRSGMRGSSEEATGLSQAGSLENGVAGF